MLQSHSSARSTSAVLVGHLGDQVPQCWHLAWEAPPWQDHLLGQAPLLIFVTPILAGHLRLQDRAGRCTGRPGLGLFKITKDQLGWACAEQGLAKNHISYSKENLAQAEWQRCGRGHALLQLRFKGDGGICRFAGFKLKDVEQLKAYLRTHFGVDLRERSITTAGACWGDWQADENGGECRFIVDGKLGVEVPVAELSHVVALGKGDLSIEWQSSELLVGEDEVLHEIRLFVPGQGEGDDVVTAESLQDDLTNLKSGLASKGDCLSRVVDVQLSAPRGKHEFEFFEQMLKIRGKSQSYTLSYKQIARLFLLTLSANEMALVLSLESPLKQGRQSHPYIVATLSGRKMVPFDDTKDKLKSLGLPSQAQQPEKTLVPRLFKELTGKTVIAESSDFKAEIEKIKPGSPPCVNCTYKTSSGLLYPLKKSMIFIFKPVLWLRYDEISVCDFSVGLMRRSTFDLRVQDNEGIIYEFTQLDRQLLNILADFLKKMGVKCTNVENAVPSAGATTGVRSTRRAAAAAPGLAPPAKRPRQQEKQEEDAKDDAASEEDDEDFEGESASGEEDDEVSSEEEENPKPKRVTRSSKR